MLHLIFHKLYVFHPPLPTVIYEFRPLVAKATALYTGDPNQR